MPDFLGGSGLTLGIVAKVLTHLKRVFSSPKESRGIHDLVQTRIHLGLCGKKSCYIIGQINHLTFESFCPPLRKTTRLGRGEMTKLNQIRILTVDDHPLLNE